MEDTQGKRMPSTGTEMAELRSPPLSDSGHSDHDLLTPHFDSESSFTDDTGECCVAFWWSWTSMCPCGQEEETDEDEHKAWVIHGYSAKWPRVCYTMGCCGFWFWLFLLLVLLPSKPLKQTTDFPFYNLEHRTTKRQDGTNLARDECAAVSGTGQESRPRALGENDDGTIGMTLIYIKEDGNLFDPEELAKIEEFENKLKGYGDYADNMCKKVYGQGNEDLGCQRMTTPLNFFGKDGPAHEDWIVETDPYFPHAYTDYPSWFNTGLYYYSGYNETSKTFELEYNDESVDRTAQFWAQYGKDTTYTNTDFYSSNPKPLSFVDWQECQYQIDFCLTTMQTSPYLAEGTCIDNDTYIEFTSTNANAGGHEDDTIYYNCGEVMDALKEEGLGCDDSLDVYNISYFEPGTTMRDICCESCFYEWFPEVDVYGETMTASNCNDWGNSDAAIASEIVFKSLETCMDHNLGSYQTSVTLDMDQDLTNETDALEAAFVAQLEAVGASVKRKNWEEEIYLIDCNVVNTITNMIAECDIDFPWTDQKTVGDAMIVTNSFINSLATATVDLADSLSSLTINSLIITGSNIEYQSPELAVYTINNPPIYEVVDGDFGNAADMNIAKQSQAFRSYMYFGIPLDGYDTADDDEEGQLSKLGEWAFNNWQSDLESGIPGLKVYWQFGEMEGFFITSILASDMAKVLFTVIFIFFYMVYTTNSYFLATNGMFMICFNYAPTIFLYRFVANFAYFGILQQVALFIILSIGADDIFVIIDTWSQTNALHWKDQNLERRMTHTLDHSSKVMLTTSLSTTFSFLANATSSLPAIYTFGVFCAFLIIVNYIAVCLFYPTVLAVYELYFMEQTVAPIEEKCSDCDTMCSDTCGVSLGCYPLVGCACPRSAPENLKERYERFQDDEWLQKKIPVTGELRGIDEFFGGTYYHFIHKFKLILIILLIALFFGFFVQFSNIEPDPELPNIFPSGNNYGVFNRKFSEHFSRSVGSLNVFAWVVFGLTPNGVDRSGTDPTLVDDLGKPTYDADFNFLGREQMEYLVAMCEDIESGERYGDLEDRRVQDQQYGAEEVIKCPWTEFRNWIWSDDPNANWQLESGTNPSTVLILDPQWKQCIEAEGYGYHTPKTWPIDGFWNNFQRFIDWFDDEMRPDKYGYVAGTSNGQYYNEELWYLFESWTPFGVDLDCGDIQLEVTPKFTQINVQLSALSNLDYNDGIELYEQWEEWMIRWMEGNKIDEQSNQYTPTTDHCEQITPDQDSCNALSGCEYDIAGSMCRVSVVGWPGAAPDGISSGFVCDAGYFSYYYLQELIIIECFQSIFIALVLAFFVLNWATGNWFIATMSTIVITMIVIIVMGFTVTLGWKLGMLETIVYVMVVGMAVDYVVHLAEAYLDSKAEKREDRTQMMLKVRASSVLSGAISTMGGIFILFFAFIQFFVKFGVVIFCLIAVSLIYSMIFFAAVLDAMGPEQHYGEWAEIIKDSKHCMSGEDPEFTCSDCCHNCIVPANSEHYERKERTMMNVFKGVEEDEQ